MLKLAMEKCGFVVRLHLHVPVIRLGDTERVLNTKKPLSLTVFSLFFSSDKVSPMCCLLALKTYKVGNRKCENKSARNHYEHKRVIKADTVLSVCPVWLFL